MNDFYTPTGAPATSSPGASATMRAEFTAIQAGFDKLPALAGNGGKLVVVNGAGTGLEVAASINSTPIGQTTPAAGTFTTLSATGNVTIGDASGDTLTIAPSAITWSNNPTHSGNHTFSSTITGNITGNAGTVTNGVYTTGDQTIGGVKTFSSTIVGSVNGNAATTDSLKATGSAADGATATTQAAKDATDKIATDAFVDRLRSMLASSTSGTAVVGDRGCAIHITAGFTIPASVFSKDDVFTLYNNTSGNLTITQGSGLTLRQVGTANTGDRTLAQRGVATVLFISATEAVISGGGLS